MATRSCRSRDSGGSSPPSPPQRPAPDTERCELCKAELPPEHGHVADLENQTLECACRACYLLFTRPNATRMRYRAVPDRYLKDPERTLTPAEFDQLEIPVGLAFFLNSSAADRVIGFYPSPAGATECELDLGAWERLTAEHPLLGEPAADVEAALISRADGGDRGVEYFLVPIDACYELVGRMRLHWRGFDGGAEARASITDFLDTLGPGPLSSPPGSPMSDRLVFDCVGARADRYAVVPSMILTLRISETSGQRVEAIALRCQIRIEPARRRYSDAEAERLGDLFGETQRWAETLQPVQFTTVALMVPGFTGSTELDLPIPLTYDMEIGATRYFAGLEDGEVPLLLLFSGTVFGTSDGRLSVQQVPWSKEASYRLPVAVWREAIDAHFPNSAWIKISNSTLDELLRFKTRAALPTWEATLLALLAAATAAASEQT